MTYGVILAGGIGSRMGGDKPKQYLTVSSLMSPIISSNMSKPSFEYAIAGSKVFGCAGV